MEKQILQDMTAVAEEAFRSWGVRLARGEISISEWATKFLEQIKAVLQDCAVLANGGEPLDAIGDNIVTSSLYKQSEYLGLFVSDISTGSQPLDDSFIRRCGNYAQCGKGAFYAVLRERARRQGHTKERRVLDPDAEHCNDCLRLSYRGWVPLGTLPRIGDCQCIFNCKCHFEFSKPSARVDAIHNAEAMFSWTPSDEDKHPRADDGKFATKADEGTGGKAGDGTDDKTPTTPPSSPKAWPPPEYPTDDRSDTIRFRQSRSSGSIAFRIERYGTSYGYLSAYPVGDGNSMFELDELITNDYDGTIELHLRLVSHSVNQLEKHGASLYMTDDGRNSDVYANGIENGWIDSQNRIDPAKLAEYLKIAKSDGDNSQSSRMHPSGYSEAELRAAELHLHAIESTYARRLSGGVNHLYRDREDGKETDTAMFFVSAISVDGNGKRYRTIGQTRSVDRRSFLACLYDLASHYKMNDVHLRIEGDTSVYGRHAQTIIEQLMSDGVIDRNRYVNPERIPVPDSEDTLERAMKLRGSMPNTPDATPYSPLNQSYEGRQSASPAPSRPQAKRVGKKYDIVELESGGAGSKDRRLTEIFGKTDIDDDTIAALGSAVEGLAGSVAIHYLPDVISTSINNDVYIASRKIRLSSQFGGPVIENSYFRVHSTGGGLGIKIFSSQISEAVKNGVSAITTSAAGDWASAQRDYGYNGYYTWAKFGYNGEIDWVEMESQAQRHHGVSSTEFDRQAKAFRDCKDIHSLMQAPGGSAFWEKYGHGFEGTFDLSEGSVSRHILREYCKAKGLTVDFAHEPSEIDDLPPEKEVERPPELDEEDEKILDEIWRKLAEEQDANFAGKTWDESKHKRNKGKFSRTQVNASAKPTASALDLAPRPDDEGKPAADANAGPSDPSVVDDNPASVDYEPGEIESSIDFDDIEEGETKEKIRLSARVHDLFNKTAKVILDVDLLRSPAFKSEVGVMNGLLSEAGHNVAQGEDLEAAKAHVDIYGLMKSLQAEIERRIKELDDFYSGKASNEYTVKEHKELSAARDAIKKHAKNHLWLAGVIHDEYNVYSDEADFSAEGDAITKKLTSSGIKTWQERMHKRDHGKFSSVQVDPSPNTKTDSGKGKDDEKTDDQDKKPAAPGATPEKYKKEQFISEMVDMASASVMEIASTAVDAYHGAQEIKNAAAHVEHVVAGWFSDKVQKNVAKLSERNQKIARIAYFGVAMGTKALFSTYIAGQKLAEEVSKARGATPEEAERLRSSLVGLDVTAAKPVFIAGEMLLGTAAASAMTWFPVASLSYIVYSGAKNPILTVRGAANAVKDAVAQAKTAAGKIKNALTTPSSPEDRPAEVAFTDKITASPESRGIADTLLSRIREFGDDSETYLAYYAVAVDETGDCRQAIEIADKAYRGSTAAFSFLD